MTFSPESQQYYSPQPTQNRLQPQVQTYKAPVLAVDALIWWSSSTTRGFSYASATVKLLSIISRTSSPTQQRWSCSIKLVIQLHQLSSVLKETQEAHSGVKKSSTPTAAVSLSLNPLGYAQHNSTPRSSGFNSCQLPAFNSPQPGSFSQPPRPPFSQTPRPPSLQLPAPASQPTQPFLQTPKPASSFLQALKPKPVFPATVAWDEPIVNHNVDVSPTPAARPFRSPSMSVQSSSQSQSFHDMHHQVHPHDDVSRPTTSLSHHSPLSISRPSSSQRTSNPSLSVLCPLAPCSQPPTSVASPPSRPSPSVTRPSTPTSRPPPSALRPSSSIASLMNPSSSSRDEEGSKGENPILGDAESNWALAEQPSSATASKPSLGESERELKSRTTDMAIADACAELLAKHDQEWLDLATKKGWPIERVWRVREIRARVNGMRDPTPYQAGLFHVTRKLNTELPAGHKLKLRDLHLRLKANEKVMKEVKLGKESLKVKKWIKAVKEHRASKLVGTRGSSKGIRKAGTNGYKNLKNAADNLSATTGALTFGLVCRSEFSTPVNSGLYGNGNMEGFLQETFKVSAFDFLLSAEAYSCMAHVNGKRLDGVDRLKVAIVGMILKGLRMSTGRPKLQMEYTHYRVKLMKKWHVKLSGWPSHIPFLNAHDLKDAEVRELYELLRSSTVRWEVMNNMEYEKEMAKLDKDIKNGKLDVPTRAPRSDKGKKHKTSKSKQTLNDDSSDPTPSTSSGKTKSKKPAKSTNKRKRARNEQDNGKGLRKRAKTSSDDEEPVYKSREILTDTDTDDSDSDGDSDSDSDSDNDGNGNEKGGDSAEEEVDPLDVIAGFGMEEEDEDEEDELGGGNKSGDNDDDGESW
ncbi:hypothetical protein PM082_006931 [Marasmius tenuissimus]|nr:hypothetical protein PM082_006931 [Marasmius tenuissimus]